MAGLLAIVALRVLTTTRHVSWLIKSLLSSSGSGAAVGVELGGLLAPLFTFYLH